MFDVPCIHTRCCGFGMLDAMIQGDETRQVYVCIKRSLLYWNWNGGKCTAKTDFGLPSCPRGDGLDQLNDLPQRRTAGAPNVTQPYVESRVHVPVSSQGYGRTCGQ